jgi:outer membrane protein TolC
MRQKNFYLATAFLVLILMGNASAQNDTVVRLSLSQAQEFALTNNQSILNANLDVEAAKKKVWETTAIGLPQASGTYSASYIIEMPGFYKQFMEPSIAEAYTKIPDQYKPADSAQWVNDQLNKALDDMRFSQTLDIQVSQIIFSGSYLVGLQSAKVYKSLSEMNRVKSQQEVLESVKNSYFNVLIARENKSILDTTYQNLQKTFADMKAMGQQGFLEETDVDQMQISVSTVKTSLDLITRMADIAEKLLKIQLGLSIDAQLELTDNLGQLVDGITYEQLILSDFAIENNIDYQMLKTSVTVNELLLKLNKAAYLPDIAAFYQYHKDLNSKAISFTPPQLVGLGVNIPIFSSGMRNAKVAQAKIELEKAQNTLDQASNGLKLQYYSNRSALIAARDKYVAESQNMKLAQKIYNRGLIKYKNGVISSTDLTTIQNQYLTAQSNYYQALQELVSSKNALEKMLTKN